jgi:hypothetical protein
MLLGQQSRLVEVLGTGRYIERGILIEEVDWLPIRNMKHHVVSRVPETSSPEEWHVSIKFTYMATLMISTGITGKSSMRGSYTMCQHISGKVFKSIPARGTRPMSAIATASGYSAMVPRRVCSVDGPVILR